VILVHHRRADREFREIAHHVLGIAHRGLATALLQSPRAE